MVYPSSCFTLLFFIILQHLCIYIFYANGCYTSIVSFGDSLTDTGNLKQLTFEQNLQPLGFFYPPYGETYFHKPTGRASNGRLIIDFIAASLNLPFVRPFFNEDGTQLMEIGKGVNYAVIGSTALDSSILEAMGVHNPFTNASLQVQIEWFKHSICAYVSDCSHLIGDSLIFMSQTGMNDYIDSLNDGKSIDEVERYVPFVVESIISATNELIELGAKTILVPGDLPIGCLTAMLNLYHEFDKSEYDNLTGCLLKLNKLGEYHNDLLVKELNKIREFHPHANIIYADIYNAAMQFYRSPNKYGFTNGALKSCFSVSCSCDQPDAYANWDGLHLTEAAYEVISMSLLQGSYTMPQFNSTCPTSMMKEIDGLSSFM